MGKSKTRGNGEGTIYKRTKNGKIMWCMQYTLGKTQDGKLKRKTMYGKSREEVKEKYNKLLVDIGTNTFVDKSTVTFENMAIELIEKGHNLNHLKDSAYIRKKGTLNQILGHYMGSKILQEISEKDVEDFLKYITKYANSTIEKIYGLAGATFKRAVKQKIISYNFLDDKDEFPIPKSTIIDEKVRSFTLEEQKSFLSAISSQESMLYKTQYLLELYTGMRMGEILALTLDDIDFKENIIDINNSLTKNLDDKTIIGDTTKTYSSTRKIHTEAFVMNILNKYIKNDYIINAEKLIFYNQKNKCYSVSQVNSAFKRFCKAHDISNGWDVNQHMLRHTFATRCIESGMPANVLAKILGHKSIKTTLEVYCDVFAEYERKHTLNATNYLLEQNLVLQ